MYGASLSPTMRSVSGKVILQQIWTYPLLYLSFNLISSSFSHCAKQSKIFRKILRVKGSIDEEQAFSLAVIEKQFIVTREIGTFGEGNVRKITRPISFYIGAQPKAFTPADYTLLQLSPVSNRGASLISTNRHLKSIPLGEKLHRSW